jgi:hypothetical protein
MVCPAIQECPDVVKIVFLKELEGVDVLPGVDNVQVKVLLWGHVLRGMRRMISLTTFISL